VGKLKLMLAEITIGNTLWDIKIKNHGLLCEFSGRKLTHLALFNFFIME